jgi:hypothetical protein
VVSLDVEGLAELLFDQVARAEGVGAVIETSPIAFLSNRTKAITTSSTRGQHLQDVGSDGMKAALDDEGNEQN